MTSPNLLAQSILCCVWLAGIVLGDQVHGQDVPTASSNRVIINDESSVAKAPPPSAPAPWSAATNSGGISIAKVSRGRLIRPSQSAMAPAANQSATAPAPVPPAPQSPTNSLKNGMRVHSESSLLPPTETVIGNEPLFPPLSTVSLSNALRGETADGEELRRPENISEQHLARHGTFFDVSGYRSTPRPTLTQSRICHHPLYFDDPNLERCGIHYGCLTDAVSAIRFFGRVPLTPYMMGSIHPRDCVLSPGECRCCQCFGRDAYLPPLNAEGVAWQTAATVGFVFLIP